MHLPDRSGPSRVSRYWTALVRGESSGRLAALAADLDPAMVTILNRMRVAQHDDFPDPAFVDTLEEHLMNVSRAIYPPVASSPIDSRIATEQRGVRPIIDLPQLVRHRLSAVVAAAILLVALGGIIGFWLLDQGGSGSHTGAPAIFAPATPSPAGGSTDGTLVDTVLPAGTLPAGGPTAEDTSVFVLATVPPYTHGTWTPAAGDCQCEGIRLISLVSGSLVIRADGPIQVFRSDANGTAEAISAGSDATLGAGDTILFASDVPYETTNSQSTPARVVYWVKVGLSLMHDNAAWPNEWQVTETYDYSGVGGAIDPALSGAVTLHLQRETVEPGATSKLLLTGTWFLVTDPELSQYGTNSDKSITNVTDKPVTYYAITLKPSPDTGTPAP